MEIIEGLKEEKLSTIQKYGKLNEVATLDIAGNGGAHHMYLISTADDKTAITALQFQNGPRKDPESIRGVLDQDLLEIVRDRLSGFAAGSLPTPETVKALEHVEIALMYLNKRIEDRLERDVLGTTKE